MYPESKTGWSPYVSLLFAAAAACVQSELLVRHHQLHHSTAHVFDVNLLFQDREGLFSFSSYHMEYHGMVLHDMLESSFEM